MTNFMLDHWLNPLVVSGRRFWNGYVNEVGSLDGRVSTHLSAASRVGSSINSAGKGDGSWESAREKGGRKSGRNVPKASLAGHKTEMWQK